MNNVIGRHLLCSLTDERLVSQAMSDGNFTKGIISYGAPLEAIIDNYGDIIITGVRNKHISK